MQLSSLTLSRFDDEGGFRWAGAVSSDGVSGDEPTTEELRLRQLEEERAQLRGLDDAQSEAEATTHMRRADKAGYLRQKVEEQQRADREADGADG
jgi:hypothetical protein